MTTLLLLLIVYTLLPLLIATTAFIIYFSVAEGIKYTNMILIKYKGIIGIVAIIAAIMTAISQIAPTAKALDPITNITSLSTQNNQPDNPYSTAFLDNDNNIVIQMGIYKPNHLQGAIYGYPDSKYRLESVIGAKDLVTNIINTVNQSLSEQPSAYNVDISIFGVEDSKPIKPNRKYTDYEWGHIAIPYYNISDADSLCLKHFIPNVTTLEKGDFATLRAYGLYRELKTIKRANITIYSKVSDTQRPEDRCVIFNIVISGLVNNRYEELNKFQKAIFDQYKKTLASNENIVHPYYFSISNTKP